MASNKKSFVLYCDLIDNIDHLTNEEKGILFTHLLEYVNDRNPVLDDRLILTAWKPIERQLKRDLKKFEEVKSKRSDAGKESARLRALKKEQQEQANSTSVESVEQGSTNPTVNDNESVNDNVNDINNIVIEDLPIFEPPKENNLTEEVFLKRWCDARTHYDKMPTNITKLTTYEKVDFNELKQDYNLKDFEKAMQGMFQQSTFPKTRLRPTHFLKRENFEPYLTCFTTKEKLFDNNKNEPKKTNHKTFERYV